MSTLNLRQIQGFILRMYRMPMVRYFLLKVNTPAAARVLLGRLASGDERDAPQITTAEEWHVAVPGPEDDRKAPPRRKTDYCLNVGITWSGLVALEVKDRLPRFSHGTFNAFVEGAAKRAEALGDRGASGPENWINGFGTGNDHVMVTLYALNPEAMEHYSTRLVALFAEGKAYELLAQIDGMALTEIQDGKPVPVPKVHFGYTDGITVTPPIRGGPERALADRQQPCEPWLFVLLDESKNYHLPNPPDFWRNGSFGVFKMMKQDVVGFENFLQANAHRIDPELLAAKLCGRWRNGMPLALSPDTDAPNRRIRSGALGRLRVRQQRWVGRSPRCAVPHRFPHAADESTRAACCRAGQTRRQQQWSSSCPARHALRSGVRSQPSIRWHRARAAGLFRQHLHREPIRVRAQRVVGRCGLCRQGPPASEVEGSAHRI